MFRRPAAEHPVSANSNHLSLEPFAAVQGPWRVHFDSSWGGPGAEVTFADLADWTTRPEPGIKYYSGAAVYKITFDLPQIPMDHQPSAIWLDLGDVREIADVRLNGKEL